MGNDDYKLLYEKERRKVLALEKIVRALDTWIDSQTGPWHDLEDSLLALTIRDK